MRDYGSVSPKFWTAGTGKSLRGNLPAQVVALYLMTSPHANMIGVFYCPIDYIAKETGLTIEGASKALASLIEADFCRFDEVTEEVFVHRMAAYQIGEQLDPKDKRCIGVARELEKVTSDRMRIGFRANYAVPFHLPIGHEKQPSEPPEEQAPSKPLRSQKQEQEQNQEQKHEKKSAVAPHLSGIPAGLLADYLKVRKAKKGGELTETALAGIQREADRAGLTLEQALTACCEYSWVGFNAGWYADRQGSNKSGASEPAWRKDARKRMQEAVPNIAEKSGPPAHEFFELEAKNVTAIALGK